MLTHEENMLLCQVQGEAPMGQLMRRHWIPALLSEELPVADGKPVRVRLLGENLVAFRDSDGKVGLLDELCPHRRASLVYGRNEECGLRCLYHGWKIDRHGTVVEMLSEPTASELPQKVKHIAYPTHEAGGFVWTYMGSGDAPAFRPPPFLHDDVPNISIAKIRIPSNWAQITEGQIDSAHSSSLHSSDMRPARVAQAEADAQAWYRPSTDKAPRLQSELTDYGFQYVAIRRPIKGAADHDYLRVTRFVAPFYSLIPPNNLYNVASVIVPIDDNNTMFHFLAWGAEECPETDTWRKFCGADPGVDLHPDWSPVRNIGNDFKQDRAAMADGNFTGIAGIPNQDIAMWVGMGSIVDRSQEVLGASDVAIVEFRRLMIDAAKRMRDDGVALGVGQPLIDQRKIASFEGIVPKQQDWRDQQRVTGQASTG